MNCEIITTTDFDKEFINFSIQFHSLRNDILICELGSEVNLEQGVGLRPHDGRSSILVSFQKTGIS